MTVEEIDRQCQKLRNDISSIKNDTKGYFTGNGRITILLYTWELSRLLELLGS
jgi:hypothetical protein